MPILDVQHLADWLGVPLDTARLAESLAAAEAMAAAYVGTDTLDETEREETITPPRDRKTLALRFGPLTSLIEVTHGENVLAGVQSDHWAIAWSKGFVAGESYVVTYKSGWLPADSSGNGPPEAVRTAILMIAAGVHAHGSDGGAKISERIGDWSASYAQPTNAGGGTALIPTDAALLLKQYRRPTL